VGIPARVVGARAQDVETRRFGAGHVFAEAYLRDQKRWVFVDPQMNVVGELDGKPLNTVEFRQAFSEPNPKVHYNLELGSCFYYFNYGLDWRYPLAERKKGDVLLAPKGAPIPKVFQRIGSMNPTRTTHNPADVYGPPPTIP
jgi:transglutaminase-like putative cysteine protease